MYRRTNAVIFSPTSRPIPTDDEVLFDAKEIVNRHAHPMAILAALRAIGDPYWREAVTWQIIHYWHHLEAQLDERACYEDSDGCIRCAWLSIDEAFKPIIRASLDEQIALESTQKENKTQQTDIEINTIKDQSANMYVEKLNTHTSQSKKKDLSEHTYTPTKTQAKYASNGAQNEPKTVTIINNFYGTIDQVINHQIGDQK